MTPDRPRAPRVVLRWKDDQQQPATETITNGYALKLVFGQATNGRMPGKIYLCLPDAAKSFVAGTFDAEIRKPPPPKSAPPRPPRAEEADRPAQSSLLRAAPSFRNSSQVAVICRRWALTEKPSRRLISFSSCSIFWLSNSTIFPQSWQMI